MGSYTISFGEEPDILIDRAVQLDEVYHGFLSNPPKMRSVALTGVRGSGKTVCLTQVSEYFRKQADWIVIDLNPNRNLIETLAEYLSQNQIFKSALEKVHLNLSLGPIAGISLDPPKKTADPTLLLDQMLDILTRQNKWLLVTIDEVSSTPSMMEFASQFQIYIRHKYNICVVMAGLYEDIDDLQNAKNLTFLFRSRKIYLNPLNLQLMTKSYQNNLLVSHEQALEMARMTKGFPYGFQSLGYLLENRSDLNENWQDVLPEWDALLQEGVYEKLWSEATDLDRRVLEAISKISSTKVKDIREAAQMNSSLFSTPRKRMLKKGILLSPSYGHLDFALPRFRNFIEYETGYVK